MKKNLFCFVLCLISVISYAQQGITYSGGTSTKLDYVFLSLKNDDDSEIKGSKYLSYDFKRARISDFSDKVFAIRYDIFNDQMEFQGAKNQIYIMNKNDRAREIRFFGIEGAYKIFDYISDNGTTKSGYFSILDSGEKYKILKKNKVVFIEEKASSTGYDAPRPATYKRAKDRYYIIIDAAPAVMIDPNKKRFSVLFKGQEKEVLAYIKKNKIKLNDDESLIKLVKFLNSK